VDSRLAPAYPIQRASLRGVSGVGVLRRGQLLMGPQGISTWLLYELIHRLHESGESGSKSKSSSGSLHETFELKQIDEEAFEE
jgi:hypothetical protein